MEYIDKKKQKEELSKIERAEKEINVSLAELKENVFGYDISKEMLVKFLSPESVKEYFELQYDLYSKKVGFVPRNERERMKESFDKSAEITNKVFLTIRETLAPYNTLNYSITKEGFEFSTDDVESYVSAKSTFEIASEEGEYINLLGKMYSLTHDIDEYEKKNGLRPYIFGGRLLKTNDGREIVVNIAQECRNFKTLEDFKTYVTELVTANILGKVGF